MKVGIMSMQRIINYGSFLQAYGLKKTIESLGHEVQFVDYKTEAPLISENNSEVGSVSKVKKILKLVFSPKYRALRQNEIKQNAAFGEFYAKFKNEWLPKLEISDEPNYTPKLDALVIGSDEVFNCTQSNSDVGYSKQLFGDGNNADKLITYAASFGSTTADKLEKYGIKDEIADYLKAFDCISTRDGNSHKIVSQLTGINPIDNVDPVIISDFSDEMTARIDLKDYVVVYAYSGRITNEEAKAIQKFAHRHNKKTISIGVMQAFTDLYVCADPFKLLSYIKNADYVVTDTFHGSVFSIKFQVPFATIVRESNKQKLTDLLQKFDLTDRRVNNLSELDSVLESEFDKEKVKSLIAKYHGEAVVYLKENL